jgi:hypothetical protein
VRPEQALKVRKVRPVLKVLLETKVQQVQVSRDRRVRQALQ